MHRRIETRGLLFVPDAPPRALVCFLHDHTQTCRQAYSDPEAYAQLLGPP